MVHHHHDRFRPARCCQPFELPRIDRASGVLQRDAVTANLQRQPRRRDRIDYCQPEVSNQLREGRLPADVGRTPRDPPVEALAPNTYQRRWIPEPEGEPPQISTSAGVAAARREIVIAVDEGEPVRLQQAPRRQGVEGEVEQARLPAIQQIATDHQVVGGSRNDAVELTAELDYIVFISQMQI